MNLEPIAEGFVWQCQPKTPSAVAVGPRCAVTLKQDLICTYMVQSALGVNDFVPFLSRSEDDGLTWQHQGPIWPHLKSTRSVFGSVSRSPSGSLHMFGISTPIDEPGEPFWSTETNGMKQNELFWAVSHDHGRTWTDPCPIPMPTLGSVEAPGAMCVSRSGRWLACYAPYNTFDPNVIVDRQQVVSLSSDDEGRTWDHTAMLRFEQVHSGGCQAWIVELADGRLLGTCWHHDYQEQREYPNPWSLSRDGGSTWLPTRSTGIMGQSTSLAALPDGRALLVYNQRQHGEIGVWLAVVRPTESDFGVESNDIVWRAQTPIQSVSSGGHAEWQDFSFGEPSATVLPDGTLLVTLWCIQPTDQGIRYVKLRMKY